MPGYDSLQITQDDFDGDAKTNGIRVKSVADSATYPAFDTATGALAAAIDAWTIGRAHKQVYEIVVVDNGPGKATSPVAQSKSQVIFETLDTVTGVIYRERVAYPDMTKAADGANAAWIAVGQGSNSLTIMNTAHAAWTTLKAAYDAIGRSPEGNPATLQRAYVEE